MKLRSLGLALLASAGMADAASAQAVIEKYGPLQNAVDVPRPYAIPLPPNANPRPQWEVGARYWWSEGSTRFDIDSSRLDPTLYGSPNSTLTYDGVTGNSLEFFMSVRNETDTFFKDFFGGGWLNGGSLDDEDFFAGQVKFSDTYSVIDGEGSLYLTLDIGQDFDVGYSGNLVISPFVGFNYWQESIDAHGARAAGSAALTAGNVAFRQAPTAFRPAPRSSTTRRCGRPCGSAPRSPHACSTA
jgi:hypothetical protein